MSWFVNGEERRGGVGAVGFAVCAELCIYIE